MGILKNKHCSLSITKVKDKHPKSYKRFNILTYNTIGKPVHGLVIFKIDFIQNGECSLKKVEKEAEGEEDG